jgi:hypothetical protein
MSYERTNGFPNLRTIVRTRLSDDGGSTFLSFSQAFSYHRNFTSSEGSCSIQYVYNVSSPTTVINIFVNRISGDGVMQPISEGCRWYVKKIT